MRARAAATDAEQVATDSTGGDCRRATGPAATAAEQPVTAPSAKSPTPRAPIADDTGNAAATATMPEAPSTFAGRIEYRYTRPDTRASGES